LAILIGILVKRASRQSSTTGVAMLLGFDRSELNIWPELMIAAGYNLIGGMTDLAEEASGMDNVSSTSVNAVLSGMVLLFLTPICCWILASVAKKNKTFSSRLAPWFKIPSEGYLAVVGVVIYYLWTSVSTNISAVSPLSMQTGS
jgi:hypothetical protein